MIMTQTSLHFTMDITENNDNLLIDSLNALIDSYRSKAQIDSNHPSELLKNNSN